MQTLSGSEPQPFQPHEPCPVLRLPTSGGLSEAIAESRFEKLQYYRRRLQRTGQVEVVAADRANLDELFAALVQLHARRWQDRSKPGVFSDPRVEQLHRQVTRRMLQQRMLRMYGLRLDGRWIAVYYGFAGRDRSCYYLSGFDPSFRQHSPGMLIVAHAIEQAITEGCRLFDFLRGREPYKYDWGAVDSDTYRLELPTGRWNRQVDCQHERASAPLRWAQSCATT